MSIFKKFFKHAGSKDFITIVSGLPRSGTSMMMRMLEAGGMGIVTDNIRTADDDNPRGYFEYERVKKLKEDVSCLDVCHGKAVKIISMLLFDLPSDRKYKVIFMRREMKDYLASNYSPALEPTLERLRAENLVTDKDLETIRKGKSDGRPPISPSQWLYWNVHIDGLEYTHDLIVEREGVFKECVEAIKMAKLLGFQVPTNTTVYRETDVREIEQMFEFFSSRTHSRPA